MVISGEQLQEGIRAEGSGNLTGFAKECEGGHCIDGSSESKCCLNRGEYERLQD